MEKRYTATLSRSQGRNAWATIFRHPALVDPNTNKVGLRVRQGLGTTDETEALALVEKLNHLLDDRTFWTEYLDASIGDQGYIYGDLKTRSVYSPALLLPHALAMRYLGMARQIPAIPVYLASRLLGLITYAGLAWLAVRLIPFGKWVLVSAINQCHY